MLVEPCKACRFDTFQISSIGRTGEIHLQYLGFCEVILQLQRAQTLDQLRGKCTGVRLKQARQLHGNGGCAGDDPPVGQPLVSCAQHRQQIDAVV